MTLKGSGLVRVFFFDLTSLYHRLNRLSIEPGEKIQFVHNQSPVSYTHLDVYKRQAVFQRPRRRDLLLRKHTGNLGRAIPGKAKLVYLLDNRRGFLVNEIVLVLVHEVAIYRLAGNRPEMCISDSPFCGA